jgi:serine/threonine protein kinase
MSYRPTDLEKMFTGSTPFTECHVLQVLYNLICNLNFLHSADVIHRDLKPANLLIDSSCNVTLCDFGMARTISKVRPMSPHVVSRWYRAPEIIIGLKDYDKKVDVWSAGCILADLMRFSEK